MQHKLLCTHHHSLGAALAPHPRVHPDTIHLPLSPECGRAVTQQEWEDTPGITRDTWSTLPGTVAGVGTLRARGVGTGDRHHQQSVFAALKEGVSLIIING